jgi:hypothetical protein
MHYQWQFNGTPLDRATNTFLVLNDIQPANAGSYTVTVTNQWGSTASEPAILDVDPVVSLPGNTNDPPSLSLPSMEMLDPGVPLISVDAENIGVVNIEWSSNCLNWNLLLTLTNNGRLRYFADPDAVNRLKRFYRAVGQR